ncbi:MAG: decaprenyl-phosphate phosphoribosyltransferase [Oscillospiraceae bacterium]|nr:decaprenyl-phosphate phosphoribosyltransferase [Oscillospiraceae bacterium]
MRLVSQLVKLIRPKQWIKNSYVFAALVFSGSLFNLSMFMMCCFGFTIFCISSSCVYIVNDAIDASSDRAHPQKMNRPLASGAVSITQAMLLLLTLLILLLLSFVYVNIHFRVVISIYLLINLLYSFWLKNEPIIDIICISLGFVLRAISGAVIINVTISPWLLICTFLLSLYLAINKRTCEIKNIAIEAAYKRKVLEFYTIDMLSSMSSVVLSATITAYCIYIITTELMANMLITIPFVVYGLFRYQHIANSTEYAESPETAILKDKPLLICVLIWGLACVSFMYINFT